MSRPPGLPTDAMVGASLYITRCTVANRVRRWLKRLREPRYVLGGVAVVAYFYFVVFARMGRARGRTPFTPDFLASLQPAGGALVALWILVMAAGAWLLPFNSGLLDFSAAETDFLFPAPVSRRELLVHRLLRSQVGLALAGIVPAIFIPLGSGAARVRFAVAIWIMVVTGKLYTTGVTLTKTRGLRRGWLPLALVVGVVGIVGVALSQAVLARPFTGIEDEVTRIGDAVTGGVPRVALLPLTALAGPLFAGSTGAFLRAIAGASLVLGLTLLWVMRADGALQDAAADASERSARKRSTPGLAGSRVGLWRLRAAGRPEMVFAWKAAAQTMRAVDRRTALRIVAITVALSAIALSASRRPGFAAAMGLFGMAGAAYVVLLAPQILRVDLRQDLLRLEWLKTWPIRPAEIVRGELLWPGALLTALAWALLALGFTMSTAVFETASLALRASIAVGAAALAPALVFAQLTIHNAMALLFPAWVPLGRQRARGFDAIGQRLITLGATWLSLVVALLPGAIAGGIVWFAFNRLAGSAAFIPGAAVAAMVVLLEVALATETLGPLFDKLDLTSIEAGE